jgi:hypothetical protein
MFISKEEKRWILNELVDLRGDLFDIKFSNKSEARLAVESTIRVCQSCGYETVQVQYPDGNHRCMRCGTLWQPGDVEVARGMGEVR